MPGTLLRSTLLVSAFLPRCTLPISAVDTIPLAFQHARRQLSQPFRFGQWTRLAVVGLLAGEAGSGGSFNFHNNLHPHGGVSRHLLDGGFGSIDPALYAGLITVLVLSGLVLGIILMYISSVMRFILFDSILAKECHIREGWNRRQGPGWRYFLWQLAYIIAMIAGAAILFGGPAAYAFAMGWFREPRQHLVGLILGGIIVFFLAFAFFVAAALIHVLTKDFVVPQMALEGIGALEGWRRLWPTIQAEMSGYAAYVGMKIVLAIGAGIVVTLATLLLIFLVAIPAAGLGLVAVLTGKTAGLTWNVFTITAAVIAGCILLAIFLYLIALISVPVIVFFPAYSIYFFAARYRALSLVLYPPPPPAVPAIETGSSSPPRQPPPLPLTPEPAG